MLTMSQPRLASEFKESPYSDLVLGSHIGLAPSHSKRENFASPPRMLRSVSAASPLAPVNEAAPLKSSFNDSDDEDAGQSTNLASRYNFVGKLMRPKAKEVKETKDVKATAKSSSASASSAPERKSSLTRSKASQRKSIVELEDSIAEFFGTPPPKPKKSSSKTRDGKKSASSSMQHGTSSGDSAMSDKKGNGKDRKMLEQVLGLGLVSGSSPKTGASKQLGEDPPTSKATASTSDRSTAATYTSSDRQRFSQTLDSALSRLPLGPMKTARVDVSPRSDARSVPSRSDSPALSYDRHRRPLLQMDDPGKAALVSNDQLGTTTPFVGGTSGIERSIDASAPSSVSHHLSSRDTEPLDAVSMMSNRSAGHIRSDSAASSPGSSSGPAVTMQRRTRRAGGTLPSALPPVKPPPAAALPAPPKEARPHVEQTRMPDQAALVLSQRLEAKSLAKVARSQAALPAFKAIITNMSFGRAPRKLAAHRTRAFMIQLNVGGRRFTTSSDTLCAGVASQSRIAAFIMAEVDQATREEDSPSSIAVTIVPDHLKTANSSAQLRERSRPVAGRGRAVLPIGPSTSATVRSTTSMESMSSAYCEAGDGSGSFSSPATIFTDEEDRGTKQVADERNRADSPLLPPQPKPARISTAIDAMLEEQQVALHGRAHLASKPSTSDAHNVRAPLSPRDRRTSNTGTLCPSDVYETDEEDNLSQLADLFPSPNLQPPQATRGSYFSTDSSHDVDPGLYSAKTVLKARSPDSAPSKSAPGGHRESSRSRAIMFTAVGSADTDDDRRASAVVNLRSRKNRAAFSLQQVPPPMAPLPALPETPVAMQEPATMPTITSLDIFIDRNPKSYSALLDALRDGELPSGYFVSERELAHHRQSAPSPVSSTFSGVSSRSSLSSASSSAVPEGSAADHIGRSMFKLGSLDSVKHEKTMIRLAELKKEAVWLGYSAIVELCEAEQRKLARDRW